MAIATALSVQAADKLEARLAASIAKVLPDVEVTSIAPGPIAGIYEVMLGPSLLYISEDGALYLEGRRI